MAVRHARRQGRSPGLVRNEGESEYNEGTATYVQARMMEVLSRELTLVPASESDEQYHAFANLQFKWRQFGRSSRER